MSRPPEAALTEMCQAIDHCYPCLRELTVDQIRADSELNDCTNALGVLTRCIEAMKRSQLGPSTTKGKSP